MPNTQAGHIVFTEVRKIFRLSCSDELIPIFSSFSMKENLVNLENTRKPNEIIAQASYVIYLVKPLTLFASKKVKGRVIQSSPSSGNEELFLKSEESPLGNYPS